MFGRVLVRCCSRLSPPAVVVRSWLVEAVRKFEDVVRLWPLLFFRGSSGVVAVRSWVHGGRRFVSDRAGFWSRSVQVLFQSYASVCSSLLLAEILEGWLRFFLISLVCGSRLFKVCFSLLVVFLPDLASSWTPFKVARGRSMWLFKVFKVMVRSGSSRWWCFMVVSVEVVANCVVFVQGLLVDVPVYRGSWVQIDVGG